MKTARKGIQSLAFFLLTMFTASVYAVPIQGYLMMSSIAGFKLTDAALTTGGVSADVATGIDFSPDGPGGNFFVSGTMGHFASISTFSFGTITDFQFVDPFAAITDFWTVTDGSNSFAFDLLSVNVEYLAASGIVLTGSGMVRSLIGGVPDTYLDPTSASWSLSGDLIKGTAIFALSSTTSASSVPEPSVLALMGIGLLGMGLVRIRHSRLS